MTWLIVVVACLVMAAGAEADIINGGFETGDPTGWTVQIPPALPPADTYQGWLNQPEGRADVIDSFTLWGDYNTFRTYVPVDGRHFADMMSALYNTTTPTLVLTSLSQEIYLTKGDYLSGSAAYYHHNPFAGENSAWVKIYKNGAGIANPWYANGGGYVSGYGTLPNAWNTASPWINWGWTAPETGLYTLELAQQSMAPGGVGTFADVVFFDNISVPEPSTMLLLGFGIIGVAGLKRVRGRG
jgi:PEP-CTERM motif